MGIQLCPVHGWVGIAETCAHVAEQIGAGAVPDIHRVNIVNELTVCRDCFNSLGFGGFASLADLPKEKLLELTDGRWEAYLTAYEAIERRAVVCPSCLSQLLGDNSE